MQFMLFLTFYTVASTLIPPGITTQTFMASQETPCSLVGAGPEVRGHASRHCGRFQGPELVQLLLVLFLMLVYVGVLNLITC